MSLKEIFCQDKAIDILQRAFAADRVPHAYIFAGPEGVGKSETACRWAKLLLCEKPVMENGFTDSCGLCKSCRLLDAGSHPDFNSVYKELLEFTKDNQNKKTPVEFAIDVVREFVIAKVSNKPTLSLRKVFVLSETEKLNNESQNCLLKVLEEPPEYCCIILLCTRLERLLPTVRSRCQIIRFSPIAEEKIIDKLKQFGLEESKARYFARLAQGSLGQGCKLAQLELADTGLYETKKGLVNSLAEYQYSDALDMAEQLLAVSKKIAAAWADIDKATSRTDINRKAAGIIVRIIVSALHDAMKLGIMPQTDLINFDQPRQLKKLTERFDAEKSAEKIIDCYRTLRWIDSAVNEKLIFEQLLLNLAVSDKIQF